MSVLIFGAKLRMSEPYFCKSPTVKKIDPDSKYRREAFLFISAFSAEGSGLDHESIAL